MSFNPNDHLIDIKGKKYLQVAHRLVWFREEHPDWCIETELVERGDGWALFKAYIKDNEGKVLATGTKVETKQGFPDFLEKAETGAIGRALAIAGYGTQFAPEFDEQDRLADSPVHIDQNNVSEKIAEIKNKVKG